MNTLNDILTGLDKIQGLSAVGLVCFSCIVVGYTLRFIKQFPNDAIPVVVILFGGFGMMVLADARPHDMPGRIWVFRNVFVGLIIGFVSWMLHYIVLSKIENYIADKFPSVKDTTFFSRSKNGTVEQVTPKQNDETTKP